MIVCIAEKPSVAKDIAKVLGATTSRQGYMEGNGYQVTWVYGHLCELKEPHDYNPLWKSWSLGVLPMIPPRFGIKLKDDQGVKAQFAIIEKLVTNADRVINCGDAGQEGELIQRWVMQKAGVTCPVQRLWISSLTEEAIREGFQSLKDQSEYQSLYLAGLSRAVGDWLLGMNATRLYTVKYGHRGQVLSIGRVQTPTLAMIVNRQKEIENFVPKQSWVLSTLYRNVKFTAIAHDEDAEAEEAAEIAAAEKEGKTLKSKGPVFKQIEYLTQEVGERVLDGIRNNPFNVISVTKKKGTETPPRLYDLTSLQVDCNKKFGYSADQTLQLIQSLYEKKFTTYPRVDTTFLSDDIYPKCPNIMNGLFKTTFAGKAPYAELVRPLGGKPLKKSKKVFDSSKVTDHHAIIPTGIPPQGLSDMELRVFDLVAKAFIAAFYPDVKYDTTTILGEVKYDHPEDDQAQTSASMLNNEDKVVLFRTSTKIITDEGWRVVFKSGDSKNDDPNADDADQNANENAADTSPKFTKGESGEHIPALSEKWTQPPKPYTEATLLRAMETAGRFVDNDELRDAMKENGIGRPSTRASIIETLFRRKYIRKERKNLVATPTGIELIDIIREDILKSPELTGVWEKKLRDIERKSYDALQFVNELKAQLSAIVNQVLADNSNRRVATFEPEEAKKKKSAAKKASGTAQKAGSSARKSTATPQPSAATPQANQSATPQPSAANAQANQPATGQNGASVAAQAQHIPVVGSPCPLCKTGKVIKGHTAYGCSNWASGCGYRVPFT